MLEGAGFVVDLAGSGEMSIAAAGTEDYDLILMDIQMPFMDGFEATKAIRAGEAKHERRRTPIIAVTAHAIEGYREMCIEAGMEDYITKPLKKKTFLEIITRWAAPASVTENNETTDSGTVI